MQRFFYFPCTCRGKLLPGFSPKTSLSLDYFLKDLKIWSDLGISLVKVNGEVRRIDSFKF